MADNKKAGKGQAAQRNRDAARARAEAERLKAAQAAKERRTKLIAIIAGVVVVMVVAVAVVLVLRQASKSSFDEIGARPPGAIEAGSIVIGQDLVPGGQPAEGKEVVVVRIYSDYICPACGSLERRLSGKLEELAASGKIKLEVQPVVFLDYQSQGSEYSTRATNAAMTVAKYAPESFLAFHAKLFETGTQPSEGTEGLTDEQLVEVAQGVGVPEDVTAKFADREFAAWLEYTTQQAVSDGVGGTPSMWIGKSDGKLTQVKNANAVNLDDAIARVLAGDSPD
ncbi:MAG: DsbA family protein [Bifidobacteriaceae bacterium]|jgi:protein-disulfide isomerase|nr:DsbA family protein [Bifidobacteriaceae bacterium]